MDKHQLLQKKIVYQRLANKLKECSGFSIIEILDNQSELVKKYECLYNKVSRNNYPIYDSDMYSKNFYKHFDWLKTILPIGDNDEWILSLSNYYGWFIHIKVLNLEKTMYDLWWNQNTSITFIDLNNEMVIDIGVLETTIDVRVISFLSNEKRK